MRENLIGYLIDALEPEDRQSIERSLDSSDTGSSLRSDLTIIRKAFGPLAIDREPLVSPPGLTARTMRFIAARPELLPRPMSPESSLRIEPNRNLWIDRMLLTAIALAASVLIGPLLMDLISDSRLTQWEGKITKTSHALEGYVQSHRQLPTPDSTGPLSRAGWYAPVLVSEHRLIADDGTLVCPGSDLDRRRHLITPTTEELRSAIGTDRFDDLVRDMGGDLGYTLGHRDQDGLLQPVASQNRSHHPIMADRPSLNLESSRNHFGGLHYILFEDGHYERKLLERLHDDDDHLYKNHDGQAAAGKNPEDAVIGASETQP